MISYKNIDFAADARRLLFTVTAPELDSYWQEVLRGLESNKLDVALAAIYSFNPFESTVAFQGGLGIPQDHLLAAKNSSLEDVDNPLMQPFKDSMIADRPIVLQCNSDSIQKELLNGISWRGFAEPSNALAIFPLAAGKSTGGFLLIGLNPRRPYDDHYDGFLQLLSRQLSTSLTSATLMHQARRKQAELSKDLAAGESRFKALTELSTAGSVLLIFTHKARMFTQS